MQGYYLDLGISGHAPYLRIAWQEAACMYCERSSCKEQVLWKVHALHCCMSRASVDAVHAGSGMKGQT